MAHMHYRTKGIILRKQDRGEADQLLTVFSKDFGRVEVLARAVRKIKSKLRSGAQLFELSEIEFVQGKNHKTLTDALIIDKFKAIRQDLQKLKTAYKIAEVFDKMITGQEKDEKLWQLFEQVFSRLSRAGANDLPMLYKYFVWQFLTIQGYDPRHYEL